MKLKLKPLTLLTCTMLLLASCSLPLKSNQPSTHTYRLAPHINPQSEIAPRLDAHLYLPRIEVTPGLDNSHIVILKTPYEQDYIAHSQWPDELPGYLLSVITDALSASNIFATVSNKQVNNSNNYKLLLKVSAFQVELPQPNATNAKVVIKMEAFVIDSKSKKLLMHRRYKVEGKHIEVRVSSLVKAFNTSLSKVLVLLSGDLKSTLLSRIKVK